MTTKTEPVTSEHARGFVQALASSDRTAGWLSAAVNPLFDFESNRKALAMYLHQIATALERDAERQAKIQESVADSNVRYDNALTKLED